METIWSKCCFCISLPRGVICYGVFSLIYYCTSITGGTLLVSTGKIFGLVILGFLVIFCCTLSLLSSVLLIIGVCVESRRMFLPWMIIIPFTNILTIVHTIASNYLEEGPGSLGFDLIIFFIFSYGVFCAILLQRKISSTKVSHQGKLISPVKANNAILSDNITKKSNSPTLSKVTLENSCEPSSPTTCHIFLGVD